MCVYMEKKRENVEKKMGHPTVQFRPVWDSPKTFTDKKKRLEPPPEAISTSINVDFLQAKMGPPQQKKRQGFWLGYHMCMFFLREQPVIFVQIWKCFC